MTEQLSLGPKVARFFETYLVHPKGDLYGQPFVLDPWERAFLNEAYRVNENGDRLYRQVLLGIPRGNGKTPIAAGIGLYELMARKDAPEIYNIAGSKDQAKTLTDFATAFVTRGPEGKPGQLSRWLDTNKRSVTHKTNFGVMQLLSSAGSLQHSKSPSVFLADELHAFETEDQEEAYTAMWTGLHKRRNAFGMIITTAGFKKATLLGRMYDQALQKLELEEHRVVDGIGPCLLIGRDLENGILFVWYGPPARKPNGDELTVEEIVNDDRIVRAVNPASFLDVDTIRKNLEGLGSDEYEFARLHCNFWTQSRDVFIPAGPWAACRSAIEPKRKRPIWVAVDIGLTHDTTAVAWSQPLPKPPERPDAKCDVVTRVRVWSANPDHENDRSFRHKWVPNRVDLEEVEEFILELHRAYGIRELVFDPTFFEGEAQRLAKKGIRSAPIYQNGVLPAIAYQRFYQDVKEGHALHAGDPVFTRHVLAAAGVKTEKGWRVSELRSSEVIDALQAGSMSHWRASRQGGAVYEDRGLLVLGDDGDDEDDDFDD